MTASTLRGFLPPRGIGRGNGAPWVAGDRAAHRQQEPNVGDRGGERTTCRQVDPVGIGRGRSAVGGLQSDQAAERGRGADRAAAVGGGSEGGDAGRERGAGAPAGAAGRPLGPPRVRVVPTRVFVVYPANANSGTLVSRRRSRPPGAAARPGRRGSAAGASANGASRTSTMPATSSLSFTKSGRPASGLAPPRRDARRLRASSSACSRTRVTALSSALRRSIRARARLTSSTVETLPLPDRLREVRRFIVCIFPRARVAAPVVPQNHGGGVASRHAHHAAARVCAAAAEVDALDRRPVVAVDRDRPEAEHLVRRELALHDVPAQQAEALLDVLRRRGPRCARSPLEARRVPREVVDDARPRRPRAPCPMIPRGARRARTG